MKGEGNSIDYVNRFYDNRIGRFFSKDPLFSSYPYLSVYQFASNSPINGIDMDGLEHYITTDGIYLGKPKSSTNETVRVVTTSDASKLKNNLDVIHDRAETKNGLSYKELIVYSYDSTTKGVITSSMKFDHFKDLGHVMYGEDGGNESDKIAHLMFNREIEFAKWAKKNANTPIGMDKNGKKQYPTESNSELLKYIKKYSFIEYVIYGTFKPFDAKAIEGYKSTIENGSPQIDGGIENKNYSNYFQYKSDIFTLQKKIKNVTKIFKSIIDARLGNTTDKFPNYEGWRGKGTGKGTTPVNEVQNVESDPIKS